MAKTRLNAVSVYLSDAEKELLQTAATRAGRSMSSFLVTIGVQHARERGMKLHGRKAKGRRARIGNSTHR